MGIRKTLTTIALVGLLALIGCKKDKQRNIETPKPKRSYHTKTFGGSPVLVKEHLDGSFTFYRDKNSDGWADSIGKGFYWFGMSKETAEKDLPSHRYRMEDLQKNPIPFPSDFTGW